MHTTKAEVKLYLNRGEVKPQKFPPVKTLPCPHCGVGLPHMRTGKRTTQKFTYIPMDGDHVTNTCPALSKDTKKETPNET